MELDLETMKFYGLIAITVERELGASIYDDEAKGFQAKIHQEYLDQGKPKNAKAWVAKEIKKHFLCAGKPPVWIERRTTPRWPFLAGQPMIFIDQVTVPDNELTEAKLSAGAVVYIFGAREPGESAGSWRMVYRVLHQVPGL